MRPLSVFALAALLGCASDPAAQEPIAALYEPPGTLPIRVGLRSDNSLPSQLYGGAVIRDLKQMNLFTEIVHPGNAWCTLITGIILQIVCPCIHQIYNAGIIHQIKNRRVQIIIKIIV